MAVLATAFAACGQEAQRTTAAEQRIAAGAQLRLADFPSGWQAGGRNESLPSRCPAVKEAKRAVSARVTSAVFAHGKNTQAESAVYLYSDTATAQQSFAALTTSATRACLARELAARLEKAARASRARLAVGQPRTGRVAVDRLGDEHDAARITLPVRTRATDVDLIVDIVYIRVGRGLALPFFVDALAPFDQDLRADLTGKVVHRLAAQLG
jgi:hypothetical protein